MVKRLSEISTFVRGIAFPKSAKKLREQSECVGVVTTKAAQATGIIDKDIIYIDNSYANNEKILQEGDILISIANSLSLLGRTTYVDKQHEGLSFGAFMSIIRVNKEHALPKMLYYLLNSDVAKKHYLTKARTTTNISNLTFKDLGNFTFPLPPLADQQRIVSRIESLFEKLNHADEIIKNVFDKFPLRKAAILHQAFSGELTATWREENNISMDTWGEIKINDVCIINPKRTNINGVDDSTKVSFVPMASVSDTSGAIIDYLNRPLKEVKKGYTSFEEGDVIFAKITPCMENGKCAIVGKLKNGIGFGSTEFHVLRCKPNIDRKFLYYILRNQKFRDEAKGSMTGSVGQQRVPKSFIENHLLQLPPLSEQKEIVSRLESIFEKEERAKELCDQTEKIELMKKAILARAFRGLL